MGSISSAIALAAAALATDPLALAMEENGHALCFTRTYDDAWIKSHPGQQLRGVRLAFNGRDSSDGPEVRLELRGKDKPAYVFGECHWFEGDANRTAQGDVIDPSFKPTSGLGCMVYTDTTGISAEEGGWFQGEWVDGGKALQLHFDESMAGWNDRDFHEDADSVTVASADRILRVNRAAEEECADLIALFPAGAE